MTNKQCKFYTLITDFVLSIQLLNFVFQSYNFVIHLAEKGFLESIITLSLNASISLLLFYIISRSASDHPCYKGVMNLYDYEIEE